MVRAAWSEFICDPDSTAFGPTVATISPSTFPGDPGLAFFLIFFLKLLLRPAHNAGGMWMEHRDTNFIKGILENDSALLETLYNRFLPPLYHMLRRKGGNFEDAKDVFQEAIVVVFHHAARPGFKLTAPFQSYLLGIGRFIWLRQLKKNARTEVTSEWEEGFDIKADLEQQIFESERMALYREKFARLGQDCQKLLQRFFDREPLNTIASDMGYTEDYIKKKNKVCKTKLMELIRNDARFAELGRPSLTRNTQTAPYGR